MSFDIAISNGDFTLTSGDITTVVGQAKLTQDLLKIALTEAGSNTLQPWYGSLISQSLIGSILNPTITVSVAQSQLTTAIQNLKNLQATQVQSGQKVSPDEQIAFIKNISIMQNTIDPRLFQVIIQVLSRSFGLVSAQFVANQ